MRNRAAETFGGIGQTDRPDAAVINGGCVFRFRHEVSERLFSISKRLRSPCKKKTTFYFTKDGIKIEATFENGKCSKITYTPIKFRWTKEDEVKLRKINDSAHDWYSQSDMWETCWHSVGGLFFLRPSFSQTITIQTDESYYRDLAIKEAKQKAAQQAARETESKKLRGL